MSNELSKEMYIKFTINRVYLWFQPFPQILHHPAFRTKHFSMCLIPMLHSVPMNTKLCSYNVLLCPLLLLSHFSRIRFCATPWTAAHQAPLSMGFSRQESWSGVPLPLPTISSKSLTLKSQS